jgi:hypothetical protein
MLVGKIRVVEMGRTCSTHGGMAYSFAILEGKLKVRDNFVHSSINTKTRLKWNRRDRVDTIHWLGIGFSGRPLRTPHFFEFYRMN